MRAVMRILLAILLLALSCTAIPEQHGSLDVSFCPACEQAMLGAIGNASEIECAFYDLDDEALERLLAEKRAEVLVFADNYRGVGTKVPARHGGLMHDKFCILDHDAVITGSTNPTHNGFTRNDNNLVIIHGRALAQNYLDEWSELAGKKTERKVRYPVINHTNTLTDSSFLIENYFCPEDDCEQEVLDELDKTHSSIDFMTFSFTSDPIGDLLVERYEEGAEVRGVFERRQENRYSEYAKLKAAGLDVRFDANPATMHHKVFVIDAGTPVATVITGSYNPTASGNTRNDENVLIIHDPGVVQAFSEEFSRIWATTEAAPEPEAI